MTLQTYSWLDGIWTSGCFVTDRGASAWFHSCRDGPGVYRLIASTSDSVVLPAMLDRVCGKDWTGTIYIGAARNLRPRVGTLVMQHDTTLFRTRGHKALPGRLALAFPPTHLAVSWQYVEEGTNPFVRERQLLESYKDAFGETPPLNAQG